MLIESNRILSAMASQINPVGLREGTLIPFMQPDCYYDETAAPTVTTSDQITAMRKRGQRFPHVLREDL